MRNFTSTSDQFVFDLKNNRFRILVYAILVMAGNLFFVNKACSQNIWDGSSSTAWATGTNWSLGHAPTSGEDVIIGDFVPGSQPTLSANTTINSLTIIGRSATSSTRGGILTISTGVTLTVTNNLTINGSSGGGSGITGMGITATGGTGSITVGGNLLTVNSTGGPPEEPNIVMGSGTLTVTGNLTFGTTTTFTAGTSTVTFNGTSGTQTINDGTADNFNNITKTGAGIAQLLSNVPVVGNLVVSTGTMDLNTFTANRTGAGGTLSVASGATLDLGATTGGQTGSNFPTLFSTVTLTAGSTVNYSNAAAQTVYSTPQYSNLTLSGGGAKVTTSVTVNGILSMEGTATASATIAYGGSATLQYNTSTARTVSTNEWLATFAATGGVIVANTGTITLNGAKQFGSNTNVPLNINSGATLSTSGSNFGLTFHGNFINDGTLTAGSSAIIIAGTVASQSIDGFTTTGTVSMTKTGGTATFQSDVNGGALTIGPAVGGTLNLGAGLTHTFTGIVTLTSGTLNGGSSTLNENATSATAWNGTGSVFSAGTGTVNFGGAAQTISASTTTFNNLILSNSGVKTFSNLVNVNLNFSISGTASALLPNTTTSTANTLSLGGVGVSNGFWGGTGSAAAHQSLAYFGSTTTGVLNVSVTSCSAGSWIGLTNTDWNTASNWCDGTVPTASTNVTILSTATNQPIIGGAGGVCNSISIGAGANLTITGSNTLTVSGDWTKTGTFTANSSTVDFSGAGAGNIGASNFNNITFSGAGTKTATGILTIAGNVIISNNFTAGAFTHTVGGNWTNNGGAFTVGSSTINFNGTGAQSINGSAASQTFNNVTTNKTAGTLLNTGGSTTSLTTNNFTATTGNFSAPSTLDINGTLTLTAGTFVAGTNLTIAGDWTKATAVVFTQGSGTVTFDGTGAQTINGTSVSQTFNDVVVSKTAGTLLSTGGGLTTLVVNNFTETTGNFTAPATFDINSNLVLTAGTFTAGTNITIAGDWTKATAAVFTQGSGTVTFDGTGTQTINGTSASQTFNNVVVGKTGGTLLTTGGSTTSLIVNIFTETTGDFTSPPTFDINSNLTLTAGTFTAGVNLTIAGNWTKATGATFSPGSGTVTFDGTGAQTISGTSVSQTFNDVVIVKTVGTLLNTAASTVTLVVNNLTETTGNFTPPATLDINGNFILTAGTFIAGTTITIAGDWTKATAAVFTQGSGTVTFDGTGTQTINGTSASQTFNNIVLSKTAATLLTTGGSTTTLVVNNFTETTGDFTAPATLDINGTLILSSGTFTAGAAITAAGDWTVASGATFTPGSGTVTFDGTGTQTINGTSTSQTFNNVVESKTVATLLTTGGSTTTLTVNNFTETTGNFNAPATFDINGNVTLTAGTFTANTTITIAGNWTKATAAVFTQGSGTVTFDGTGAQTINGTSASQTFNNIVISKTAPTLLNTGGSTTSLTVNNLTETTGDFTAPTTLDINGTLILSAGTFTAGTTITIAGDWTVATGATFTPSSGTVNFDRAGVQAINGTVASHSFNNLILSGSGAKTFTVTTTISGNLSMTGTASALLSDGTTSTSGTLTLGGIGVSSGSWGGTTSAATHQSSTYFGSTTTGILNVSSSGCSAGDWVGFTSVDWNTGSNWCNGTVPTSSTDVVIQTGTPFQPTIASGTTAVCKNITINGSATLTLASSASALLNISGDFTNNGTLSQGALAIVSFVGTAAQAMGGSSTTSFSKLVIANSSATVTANTNFNISSTFTVNASATFSPAAAVVINTALAAGTISGSGTIQVTRIAATADYSNQYKFSTNTLSSLTVDYAGAGAQNINPSTYGNLITSGSGTKTLVTSTSTVNGNVTIGSTTTLDVAAITMTLSAGSVLAVNGILNFSSATGLIQSGTSGTTTLTMGSAGTIRTLDPTGLGPAAGASLVTQAGGSWVTSSIATNGTVEYYINTAGGAVTDIDYNNLTITGATFAKTWTIGGTRTVSGNVSIAGNFTLSGAQTINVKGDWTKTSGTLTPGSSTINFSGSGASVISGASTSTFNNLTVNKDAAATIVTSSGNSFTAAGALTVTQGNLLLTSTNANYTVTGDLTVSANGTLTHQVDWLTGFLLSVAGNVSIDGIYSIGTAPRAHLQMTGSTKTVHSGTSSFNIFTIASAGTISANGPVTVNDNFWAPISSGTFATNGQTVIANASLLISGGTTTVNGGSLTVTGGIVIGSNNLAGTLSYTSGSLTTDAITIGDGGSATTGIGTFTQSSGTNAIVNGAVTINQQQISATTNAWNINAGTATVSGLITFAGTSTTTTRVGTIVITSGTLNANGGITFSGTTAANKVITMSGAPGTGTINMKGALTGATNATLTAGTLGSNFNYYDNTTAQTVNYFGSGAYNNLLINTTGGAGATLSAAVSATNVTGNLRVQSGTLKNGGFAIVGNAARTFEVANGAFFEMSGTATFPTVFGTFTFGPTSTTRYLQSNAQNISAQTYGHLDIKPSANTITHTFAAGTTNVAGNLTVGNGTNTADVVTAATNSTTLNVTGNVSISANTTLTAHASNAFTVGGDWSRTGTFTHSNGTVTFNGSGAQSFTGATTFNNLILSKSSGGTVTLNNDLTVANVFTFASGNTGTVTTGSNTLIISNTATAAVVRTGLGYIIGNMRRGILAGTNTYPFDFGTAAAYAPVSIAFTAGTLTGVLNGSTTDGDHPNIGTSTLQAGISVNRYWNFNISSGLGTANYDATFNWVSADEDASFEAIDPSGAVRVGKYTSGTWSYPTIGTNTETSIQITGASGFSDFQVAQNCVDPSVPTVSNSLPTICNGGTSTLSISSGSLNSAANWQWYSGSCGGTPVGMGTSVMVSPSITTNYFVRGEGGCVTAGSCAMVTVTVVASPTGPTLNAMTPATSNICKGTDVFASFFAGSGGVGCSDSYQYSIDNGMNWFSYTPGNHITTTSATIILIQGKRDGCTSGAGCSGTSFTTLASWTAYANPVVTPVNSCKNGSNVTFTQSGGETGGTWMVSGGGTIDMSTGEFTPTTEGCFTATYTTPTALCPDTKSFIVYPETPLAPTATNTCGTALMIDNSPSGVGGFNLQYSFDGGANWQPTATSPTNTPGCYDMKIRWRNNADCAAGDMNTPNCTSPSGFAIIYPSTPDAPTATNTCGTALTINNAPTSSGFTLEYSFDGGGTWQASATSPLSDLGCYDMKMRWLNDLACGGTSANTPNCTSALGNAIIYPATPAAPTATNTCNSALMITNGPDAVGGFTLEYSFNGGTSWQTSDISPSATPGCYDMKMHWLNNSACGSTDMNTANCLSTSWHAVIFPASPVIVAPDNTCDEAFVLPDVDAVDGFDIVFSIDDGAYEASPSVADPGCHTVKARYILAADCGSTLEGASGSGACDESNEVSVVIFPAAPSMTALSDKCDTQLDNISPVADLTASGFTAEYAVQAPGGSLSTYGTLSAANALLTNTPGCWTVKSRYKLTSACGDTPADAVSGSPACQESTIHAVVFPAAPVITEPATTCNTAFTLPGVSPVSEFDIQYSIDAGAYSASPSTSVPGCHTVSARYVLSTTCGSTTAGTAGPGACAASNTVSVVIFPTAPVITSPANTCNAMFTLPTVTTVSGFSVQYSIDAGMYSASPSTTTPGCHTVSARYVLTSTCGSTTAGTPGTGSCGESNVVNTVIFPAAPLAPDVNSGCHAIVVTPPPTVAGFTIEYSFNDGGTWGSNMPPTAENCSGYNIRTRYVLSADCLPSMAGDSSANPSCRRSPPINRVIDLTAPMVTAPTVTGIQCSTAIPAAVTTMTAYQGLGGTASDNCTATGSLTVTSITGPLVGSECSGTITRTYTISDACGNSTTANHVFNVTDTTIPTFTRPANITIFTNSVCGYDASVANTGDVTNEADNCSVGLNATFTDVNIAFQCQGGRKITRTWNVVDNCGNSAGTQVQVITVKDNTPPTFTAPADITIYTDGSCNYDAGIGITGDVINEADNCSSFIEATPSDAAPVAGACPGAWTITRTWNLTDGCGNSTNHNQIITVRDNTPPTVSGTIANVTVEGCTAGDAPAAATTIAGLEALTGTMMSDNCTTHASLAVSHTDSPAGSCPIVVTRTYKVSDLCGNTSVGISHMITIRDITNPTASNPTTANVQCFSLIPAPNVSAVTDEADNCGGTPTVTFVNDDITSAVCDGATVTVTRTYKVIDCSGNFINVFQTINVDDTTNPTASNPEDINVECFSEIPAPNIALVTDESDNCDGTPSVTFISDDITSAVCDGATVTVTRTFRITDCSGNTSDVYQSINVDDITDPTAGNPMAVTVDCFSDIPTPNPAVVIGEADNCDGAPIVTFVSDDITVAPCDGLPIDVTRTYKVEDCSGNFINVFQIIHVDLIPPTAGNPSDINVECFSEIPSPNSTVVTDEADNCGTTPTVTFISDDITSAVCDGATVTVTRTYRVKDCAGNTVDVYQSINVDDITNPTASNPADIDVQCFSDIPSPSVAVVTDEADNCDGSPSVSFMNDDVTSAVCDGAIVTVTRTYRITDCSGNTTDVYQSINVDDITNPTASNPADINVECFSDIPSPNVSVVTNEADNCDGTPMVSFMNDDISSAVCDGSAVTVTRMYRITDCSGNTIDVYQSINVDDITNPIASNPADIDVECFSEIPVPNVAVVTDEADNCDGTPMVSFMNDDITSAVCDGATVTVTRTYRITDCSGNTSDVYQSINVDDITNPTASNPADINLECFSEIPVPNVTVVTNEADNCDGTPMVSFVSDDITSAVCDGATETVTRTYRITDCSGNTIDVYQSINIDDVTNPTASNPADIDVECFSDIPSPNGAVVTDEADNCDGAPMVSFMNDDITSAVCDGATVTVTRTYRITDCSGNTTDVYQSINVDDITNPTAGNPADIDVECFSEIPAPNVAVVTDEADNCDGTPMVSFMNDDITSAECDGSTVTVTRTYRITDCSGNTLDVYQSINVDDITDPTASNPADINVECFSDIPSPNEVVVTDEADNCDGTPMVSFMNDDITSAVCDGATVTVMRTYRITDCSGNTADVYQSINVDDITDPTASNPADIDVECFSDIPSPNISVVTDEADNCDGTPSVSFLNDDITSAVCDGATVTVMRTYRVTDCSGNFFDVFQTINVDDITNPTASNPSDINVECFSEIPLPNVTVVTDEADNCDGTPSVSFMNDDITEVICDGATVTVTRTYRVADCSGNTIDVYQSINVDDMTDPTASNPSDINVQCESEIPVPNVAVVTDETDNCDNTPSVTFITDSDNGGAGCSLDPLIVTRTYRIEDCSGNTVDVEQTITVIDITPPDITAGSIAECYASVALAEAAAIAATTATDNCSGMLTYSAYTIQNDLCDSLIRVIVTDVCGNKDSVSYLTRINCQTVRLKVYLEGPWNIVGDSMFTFINDSHLLPGQDCTLPFVPDTPHGQPYNTPPYNYNGNTGMNYGDFAGDTLYPADVVDWVLVTVRENGRLPVNNIWTCAGWVHSDGTVTFPENCPGPDINIANDYHIVVQHRNHLGILATGNLTPGMGVFIKCNGAYLYWNFTTQDSYKPTFRVGQKFMDGIWAMFAANSEQVNSITTISSPDRTLWSQQQGQVGYKKGDHNMNLTVGSEDETLWKNNQNKTTGVVFY